GHVRRRSWGIGAEPGGYRGRSRVVRGVNLRVQHPAGVRLVKTWPSANHLLDSAGNEVPCGFLEPVRRQRQEPDVPEYPVSGGAHAVIAGKRLDIKAMSLH